jgi:hypothetical protein
MYEFCLVAIGFFIGIWVRKFSELLTFAIGLALTNYAKKNKRIKVKWED